MREAEAARRAEISAPMQNFSAAPFNLLRRGWPSGELFLAADPPDSGYSIEEC
jgi:hypothetical protein